ncbi:MAG: HAMP domain-containing sensor histidine kinase [Paludibacteraceae bacterium]|nr:HAMP domain-containing sensor histidine kinase [Paludibacteraceae bacterium]
MQKLNKKILSYFVCIFLIYATGIVLGYFFRERSILIFLISCILASIVFYILARRLAIENSKRYEQTRESLYMEREKIRTHLQLSTRGRAAFSPYRKETSSNELFIQLLNMISDDKVKYSEKVFQLPEISEIVEFLDDKQVDNTKETYSKEVRFSKHNYHFLATCVVFPDKSFEITIDDITAGEDQAILKKQLAQNVSHELKTPISSILGFTETLINNPNMDEEKKLFFIERCHTQAVRLTNLLQDISMLNKLDESCDSFEMVEIDLNKLIEDVSQDVSLALEEKNMHIETILPDKLIIKGNTLQIYSIFRNLIDNSILYAGVGTTITIECYRKDKDYLYFSVADNGVGVDSKHLNKIFDRFYRVDKGRSRKLGGTGLGLSIVKNAILFHQGRISAKNRRGGGIEFLFNLHL